MADLLSIISSNYVAVGSNVNYSKGPYVPVDAASYEGNWTGKYANNDTFSIQVSNVIGFRAKARYQSGSTVKYQDVLIKDGAFRVGDTKFSLVQQGTALIANVVTDPATGSTYLDKAYATQK